jgi:oxygen-dependent protoporphyrinogen oxidase
VPLSPPAFLLSDILPLGARLRVLGEIFGRARPAHDESVFDFAARRIGRTAAEVLVDSMVTGVWAGDSRQLSLAATFPRMAAMEAEHGSLSRALLAKMREARRGGRRSAGPAGPGGTLTTFSHGMGQLPETIAESLGDRLVVGARVDHIQRTNGSVRVGGDGFELGAAAVLLATPAAATARLLKDLAPEAVDPLEAIPTVPIVVVMAGFEDPTRFGNRVSGFGFLVPGHEHLGVLGTLFCHSIFPGQAPPGHILLRTMIGGARDPAAIDLDDQTLTDRVRQANRQALGADPDPDQLWIIRHPVGISQYTIGHLERVANAERAARAAGIELAGSPYRGVSVNDCIKQARAAAARLAERVSAD